MSFFLSIFQRRGLDVCSKDGNGRAIDVAFSGDTTPPPGHSTRTVCSLTPTHLCSALSTIHGRDASGAGTSKVHWTHSYILSPDYFKHPEAASTGRVVLAAEGTSTVLMNRETGVFTTCQTTDYSSLIISVAREAGFPTRWEIKRWCDGSSSRLLCRFQCRCSHGPAVFDMRLVWNISFPSFLMPLLSKFVCRKPR